MPNDRPSVKCSMFWKFIFALWVRHNSILPAMNTSWYSHHHHALWWCNIQIQCPCHSSDLYERPFFTLVKSQTSVFKTGQKYVITVLLENLGTKLKSKIFIGFGFKFTIGRTLCSFQKTILGSPLLFCLKIFTCRPRTKSSTELLIVQNDYEIREIRRCNKHLSAKNVIWGLCMFGEFKALFSNVHCLSTLVVSW